MDCNGVKALTCGFCCPAACSTPVSEEERALPQGRGFAGSCMHTICSSLGVQQQVDDDVQQRSQDYALMLHNLMAMIQEYLLLSDDNKQRGALNSLHLVGSTAQLHEDNRICIWLEDVWSER